jgi:hypothetical protein
LDEAIASGLEFLDGIFEFLFFGVEFAGELGDFEVESDDASVAIDEVVEEERCDEAIEIAAGAEEVGEAILRHAEESGMSDSAGGEEGGFARAEGEETEELAWSEVSDGVMAAVFGLFEEFDFAVEDEGDVATDLAFVEEVLSWGELLEFGLDFGDGGEFGADSIEGFGLRDVVTHRRGWGFGGFFR